MKKNHFIVFLLCFLMLFASAGCQVADFFTAKTPTETTIESVLPNDKTDQTGDTDIPEDNADKTGNTTVTPTVCNVSIVYNNGESDGHISVQQGQTFSAPQDPVKTHYIFTGWYTSAGLNAKYDFSKSVQHDVTIYAGYSLDAVSLTNTITTETIKGVVKVRNKCFNKSFMGTSFATSQGSGFCFDIEDGTYYILTNCHVAKKIAGYSQQEYTIEDYQGNEFKGNLCQNHDKTVDSIAAEYDLACLCFKPETVTDIRVLPFADLDPAINDDIILLGAPQNQSNAITYGVVRTYTTIQVTASPEESNVTFGVIESSAYSDHGSSGGATLNSNLQIVGVSYAGNSEKTKSYSIPITKVKEFLTLYYY